MDMYKSCGAKGCEKKNDLNYCTGCFAICYCSKTCQLKDRKDHKEECIRVKNSFKPLMTDRLFGHHKDDLVIVYSKLEDLLDENRFDKKYHECFIPQWIMWNCIKEGDNITMRVTNQPMLCSFIQMNHMGVKRAESSEYKKTKVRNTYFYYTSSLLHVNDQVPFRDNEEVK